MTPKEELKGKLKTLSDRGFIRYLIQTGYCMREIWDISIDNDWSDEDINEELKWLNETELKNFEDGTNI